MPAAELLWPRRQERLLLGRFYLAVGVSRALYLIYPFEFAYLFLVMHRPEWAVLPLMAMSAAALATQVPTGAIADRWSRKGSVLIGGILSACTFASVPWAVRLAGDAQLLAACGAFAVGGIGETMMAGAQEAWVVDNLRSVGRDDLVDMFFARTYSVMAVGGVLAGLVALGMLLVARVDLGLLDLLWYAAATGFVVAVGVAATIPERRADPDSPDPGLWLRTRAALALVGRRRPLLLLTLAMVIAALSAAGAEEAFPVSLLTKGLDARALAPLGIADDLFGVAAPMIGLALARRFGSGRVLSVSLIAAGCVVTVLFATRTIAIVLLLYLVLGPIDRMWDPVALARLQREIPSIYRATIGSISYQASGLAQLAGLGLFAVLLGSHSQQLRDATPDLIQAFSGQSHVSARVPAGLAGLPVPDVAIVVFVLAGVLAVPFIVAATRPRGGHSPAPTGSPRSRPAAQTRGVPRPDAGRRFPRGVARG